MSTNHRLKFYDALESLKFLTSLQRENFLKPQLLRIFRKRKSCCPTCVIIMLCRRRGSGIKGGSTDKVDAGSLAEANDPLFLADFYE
nr:hypothetical protein Iba_chr07dCG11630 [Ipomoea batatas]